MDEIHRPIYWVNNPGRSVSKLIGIILKHMYSFKLFSTFHTTKDALINLKGLPQIYISKVFRKPSYTENSIVPFKGLCLKLYRDSFLDGPRIQKHRNSMIPFFFPRSRHQPSFQSPDTSCPRHHSLLATNHCI